MTQIIDQCTLAAKACCFISIVLYANALPDASVLFETSPKRSWQRDSHDANHQPNATSHEDAPSFVLSSPPETLAAVDVRRLTESFTVIVQPNWNFPGGTKMSFRSDLGCTIFGSGCAASVAIELMAGKRYASVVIEGPAGAKFGAEHTLAKVKLVDKDATRDNCHEPLQDVGMMSTEISGNTGPIGPSPLAMGSLLKLQVLPPNGPTLAADTTAPHLTFMQGGQYAICYNPFGSFSPTSAQMTAIVPVELNIYGVSSQCNTNDCLANERWECWFSYRAEAAGPCIFDFTIYGRQGWSVNSGTASKIWWSQAWPSDNIVNGMEFPEKCSDSFGASITPDATHFDTSTLFGAGISVDAQTAANMPPLLPRAAVDSFTVTACYCPNYDSSMAASQEACIHPAEFIQPIGAIHYWMVRICSLEGYAYCGVTGQPYMRVVPEQPFALRIQCPPGQSCAGATANRIKFLDLPDRSYEYLPSWDRANRCGHRKVDTSDKYMWASQDQKLEDLPLDGGDRKDYKVWADRHLIFTLTFGQALDLCYCEANCDIKTNYFPIGRLQTAESLGVARWSKDFSTFVPGGLDLAPIETIRYLGKGGSVSLYGGDMSPLEEGMLPYDSVPFGKRALMKLMSFDRETLYPGGLTLEEHTGLNRNSGPNAQQKLDAACAAAQYRPELNTGPNNIIAAKDYIGHIAENSQSNYLAFSGIESDQSFFIIQAGTVSICYCALVDDATMCAEDRYWLHAAKLMVYGPLGTQQLVFPVHVVVDIMLEGWGFDPTNSIRLIKPAQTCRENNFNPAGSKDFRIECPATNATGCRVPEVFEELYTFVDTGNSTEVWIDDIEINEFNTTLIFTGNIVRHIDDGDAITIAPDSVLYRFRPSHNWTAAERHTMAKLTGVHAYADDPQDFRFLWNRVSYMYRLDTGALITNKLSLAIGWRAGRVPVISFVSPGGVWIRRNKLRTRQDFLAQEPVDLKICFAVRDGDELGALQKHYAEAGQVRFVNPAEMDDAGVHLTSQVIGSVAPVVLTFSPRRGDPQYNQYDMPTVLRILWQDMDGLLQPLLSYHDEVTGELEKLPTDELVARENATQALCGLMFLEMWTNDAVGFPLPRGCYYGRTYQNKPDSPGQTMAKYREYFVIFEPKNGLKSVCTDYRFNRGGSCSYMLVLNSRVGFIRDTKTEVVTIHTLCAEVPGEKPKCGDKHSVWEWGAGLTKKITFPANNETAQLKYVEVGPPNSLREGDIPSMWDLESEFDMLTQVYPWSFEVRAWVANHAQPISRSSWLRLFFSPFGVWDIGSQPCKAVCIPPAGFNCSDGRGGAVVTCRKEPVTRTAFDGVVRMPRNLIELQYPRAMDILNGSVYNLTDVHLLRVSDLQLPTQGFFAHKFLVQLQNMQYENPSVVLTDVSFRRVPASGSTVGRLLLDGQIGSGARPFVGDRNNPLLVYGSVGVTLRHDMTAGLAAPRIELILPKGYTCLIVGDGSVDPDNTLKLFQLDRDDDGYFDYFKGNLKMGKWDSDERVCYYELAPMAALYAGTQFYVQIEVNNPLDSLARTDPINVWNIQVKGMNATIFGNWAPFISLTEELSYPEWVGNLAVLEPLKGECMQPSNFRIGATQDVSLFFQAVHSMPQGSFLYLDAPTGFNFGEICIVGDLPREIYADWRALPWGEDQVGERSKTRKLGGIISCLGDVWGVDPFEPPPTANFTRAKIELQRNLLSEAYYAFNIRVKNAPEFDQAQQDGWRIWIMSPQAYPVDGSRYTIQFNEQRIASVPPEYYDRTWGLYDRGLRQPVQMNFGAQAVLPTPDIRITQQVAIYPLQTSKNTFVNLRIHAPVGYVWDVFRTDGLFGEIPGVTCERCVLLISDRPVVNFYNELVLSRLVFRGGYLYGLRARIFIPSRPPTRSSNVFYIEMNYDKKVGDERFQAGLLPAPKLRVIHDVFIFSLCNAANYASNLIAFHLHTVSDLNENEGFVFQGDAAASGGRLFCFPEAAYGTLAIPIDVQCKIFRDPITYLPVVIISVKRTPMVAGHWGLTFANSQNVPDPVQTGGQWLIGTYGNIDQYPDLEVIDQAIRVPAPGTLLSMRHAGYLSPPEWQAVQYGRRDQPGVMNSMTFYFRLTKRLMVPPKFPTITIALRGPRGFEFAENCLSGVEVMNDTDGSTMEETGVEWPCRHKESNYSWCPTIIQDWPDGMTVVSCLGLENSAKILIENNGVLEAGIPYGLKVSMINALYGNSSDMWAIDVGPEASDPMASFPVRTFDVAETYMLVASPAVTTAASAANNGLPISLVFMPSIDVPAAWSGKRRLQAGPLSTLPEDVIRRDYWFYYTADTIEGSLIVDAPADFIFATREDRSDGQCDRMLLEELNRSPLDREAILSHPQDVWCTVEGTGNRTHIRFIDKKLLRAGVRYRLVLIVKNPLLPRNFEPWIIRTQKMRWGTKAILPLDRIVLPGYEVSFSFPRWLIENLSLEFNGGFEVRRIKFDITFSLDVLDGDTVIIIAPAGFILHDESMTNSSCLDFRYSTVLLPLLDTPPPICERSSDGESRLVFTMNEGLLSGVALESGRPLSFIVGAINPVSTPDVVQNNWKAYHRFQRDDGRLRKLALQRICSTFITDELCDDGEDWLHSQENNMGNLLGVGVATSWEIVSPIWNISIFISGPFKRAGSTSELTLKFRPTEWSTVMELVVHEPVGFIFSSASVHEPYVVDPRTGGSRLVLQNGSFLAFEPVTIVVSNVRLGIGGGATRMDFKMYETPQSEKVEGSRDNYILGFRLPGALTIVDQHLLSQPVVAHYENNETDQVLPLLPMRVGEWARIELTFSITMPVNPGDRLVLRSVNDTGPEFIGFVSPERDNGPPPNLARCSSVSLTGPTALSHSTCNATGDINITSMEMVRFRDSRYAHKIFLTLDHLSEGIGITTPPPDTPVLQASEYVDIAGQRVLTPIVYRLRAWVMPIFDPSRWRLETEDGDPMPSNTNDAITSAIRAVQPMDFTVDALRTPPASMVPATLTVGPVPRPAGLGRLKVIVPLQYTEHQAAELVTFLSTGRAIVTLDLSPTQEAKIVDESIELVPRVVTPGATGDDPRWFLIGYAWSSDIDVANRTMENSQMVSWGSAPGWTINQLNVTIAYATIAAFRGYVALYFSVPNKANGAYAIISSPLGFTIGCTEPTEGSVVRPCSSVPYQAVLYPDIHSTANLTLSGAAIEGEFLVYSFVLNIQTPVSKIGDMKWDVRVYDSEASIVDAAIGVAKPEFVADMFVTSPYFFWHSAPVAGESSTVTVQITMFRRVRQIKSCLISLPEGYRHDIMHKNQFKSLSKKFPSAIDIDWRVFTNLRWLRILVARPANKELDFIPSGTYQFEFPVMVPIRAPLATEWYFALCSSYDCDSVHPPDSSVIVYFPMPMTRSIGAPIDYRPGVLSGANSRALFGSALQLLAMVRLLLSTSCVTQWP